MRCTPIAVWGSELSIDDFKKASNLDVSFTHKAPIVKQAVFAYQLGIKYLLNNPIDKDRARKAYDFVAEVCKDFPEYNKVSIPLWLKTVQDLINNMNAAKDAYQVFSIKDKLPD